MVWYFKQTLFFFLLLLMEEKEDTDLLKNTDGGEKKGRMESIILRSKWFLKTELGEGNGTPLQYSCLENPMDGGAW